MPVDVEFYFGLGSRYSYLAATQLDRITLETGARFAWKPLYSPELIARAGPDPFRSDAERGQYAPAYRARDVARWADHYGIVYREPRKPPPDWRRLAMACIAAEQLGSAEPFARSIWRRVFVDGDAPHSDTMLLAEAAAAGIDANALADLLASERCERSHEHRLNEALAAGVFGVPTFVVRNELFWGQDRLPLLIDWLHACNGADTDGQHAAP